MILGFGEVMARLATPEHRRWRQSMPGDIEVTWGGGEANVCVSLAMYGEAVRYLTALPRQPIAQALSDTMRGLGVDMSHVLWTEGGRLGLYFVEVGANQRGSTVIYDRADSSVSLATPDQYDFAAVLDGVTHLHVSGITPAVSENAYLSNKALIQAAREAGVRVSCDLNYRKKLWRWRPGTQPRDLARECMAEILPLIDIVIGNEEDASDVLDIHAADTDVTKGNINAAAYADVARQIHSQYSNVSYVAITLRESISADRNRWGGLLFDVAANESHLAPLNAAGEYEPYEVFDIVDRVGAGDSFAAGLIHSLQNSSAADAIRFAVAASCLKHSIRGDFNYVTREEVAALAGGNATGRVQR